MAIYAALTYDIISATNSSPQTTEINADKRAETLMKWVKIGLWQAAGFGLLGVILEISDGESWWPPALGSITAGVLLWIQYVHALEAGVNSKKPGTEDYGDRGEENARR
jgi:hypothetical protein